MKASNQARIQQACCHCCMRAIETVKSSPRIFQLRWWHLWSDLWFVLKQCRFSASEKKLAFFTECLILILVNSPECFSNIQNIWVLFVCVYVSKYLSINTSLKKTNLTKLATYHITSKLANIGTYGIYEFLEWGPCLDRICFMLNVMKTSHANGENGKFYTSKIFGHFK